MSAFAPMADVTRQSLRQFEPRVFNYIIFGHAKSDAYVIYIIMAWRTWQRCKHDAATLLPIC